MCRVCGKSLVDNRSPTREKEDATICRSCDSEATRRWQRANPEKHRLNKSRSQKRNRPAANKRPSSAKIRAIIGAVKDRPCKDCGQQYCPLVMEFDHVRGVKNFGLAKGLTKNVNVVIEEMDKCDVVCSNCHRFRTLKRRKNNILDQYMLNIAVVESRKSNDPNTKVGAVLLEQWGRGISKGYNHFPTGVIETPERWQRPIKYAYVLHAENAAILGAEFRHEGSILYISHFPPCPECVKIIVQSGVGEIVCAPGDFSNSKEVLPISLAMLEEAKIPIRQVRFE